MNPMPFFVFLFGFLIAQVNVGYADSSIKDGLYEVSVMLDMGATEDLNARKTVEVCVRSDAAGGAHGLFLLTNNIQLASCPIRNVSETVQSLNFDIICDGIDAGRASAIYTFENDSFEGHIAMRMGGKNMTMRETQSGRRIGDCKPQS